MKRVLLTLLLLFPMLAHAAPLPRTIIAVYDSQEFSRPELTLLHRFAELPLNHLGLTLEYHDIRAPLPDVTQRADVRGVLTWFRVIDPISDPATYLKWVDTTIASGKKFVIFGLPGIVFDRKTHPDLFEPANAVLAKLGLRYDACTGMDYWKARLKSFLFAATKQCYWVGNTRHTTLIPRDKGMTEFERPLSPIPAYNLYRQIDPAITPWLTARQSDDAKTDSVVVSTGPHGGFVDIEYAVHTFYDAAAKKDERQWYINPFHFFAAAFATDDLPKPDTTTLAGRRIYYSHIDGDGWNNQEDFQTIAARTIFERALKPYPDLPVTVAAIAADLDPTWAGSDAAQQAARDIFALPQVEPATHTYSHPFDWALFAGGQPATEPTGARGFTQKPFDLTNEINGSTDFIQPFAGDKPLRMLMWSGNTTPFEAALRMARERGLANINGGDSRDDSQFPSYTWLAPLGRAVGAERQIYASMSNENTYTHVNDAPYDGFKLLPETWEHTENPIRLKPMNLYYHMFSGMRAASLSAVLANLDIASKADVIPIATSEYAALAADFYRVSFVPVAARTWEIQNRGELQTIRFDSTESINWEKSTGIAGFTHAHGSLYIYLDASVATPIIALTDQSTIAPAYLESSRWRIWNIQRAGKKLSFTAQGYGPAAMKWQMPEDGTYEVKTPAGQGSIEARDHRLIWNPTLSALTPIEVSIERR